MAGSLFQLETYGQKIVDGASGAARRIELLSRLDPAMARDVSVEAFFKNLSLEDAFEIALAQVDTAAELHERTGLPASINVDPRLLLEGSFGEALSAACEGAGAAFSFEITEHCELPCHMVMNKRFRTFRRLKVFLSLDDFGSGMARSPEIIEKYDFDAIKIDRKLIGRIGEDDAQAEKVFFIFELIEAAGKEIIAEGVETEAQRQALLAAGVTLHQGYLYHRPEPVDQLEAAA